MKFKFRCDAVDVPPHVFPLSSSSETSRPREPPTQSYSFTPLDDISELCLLPPPKDDNNHRHDGNADAVLWHFDAVKIGHSVNDQSAPTNINFRSFDSFDERSQVATTERAFHSEGISLMDSCCAAHCVTVTEIRQHNIGAPLLSFSSTNDWITLLAAQCSAEVNSLAATADAELMGGADRSTLHAEMRRHLSSLDCPPPVNSCTNESSDEILSDSLICTSSTETDPRGKPIEHFLVHVPHRGSFDWPATNEEETPPSSLLDLALGGQLFSSFSSCDGAVEFESDQCIEFRERMSRDDHCTSLLPVDDGLNPCCVDESSSSYTHASPIMMAHQHQQHHLEGASLQQLEQEIAILKSHARPTLPFDENFLHDLLCSDDDAASFTLALMNRHYSPVHISDAQTHRSSLKSFWASDGRTSLRIKALRCIRQHRQQQMVKSASTLMVGSLVASFGVAALRETLGVDFFCIIPETGLESASFPLRFSPIELESRSSSNWREEAKLCFTSQQSNISSAPDSQLPLLLEGILTYDEDEDEAQQRPPLVELTIDEDVVVDALAAAAVKPPTVRFTNCDGPEGALSVDLHIVESREDGWQERQRLEFCAKWETRRIKRLFSSDAAASVAAGAEEDVRLHFDHRGKLSRALAIDHANASHISSGCTSFAGLLFEAMCRDHDNEPEPQQLWETEDPAGALTPIVLSHTCSTVLSGRCVFVLFSGPLPCGYCPTATDIVRTFLSLSRSQRRIVPVVCCAHTVHAKCCDVQLQRAAVCVTVVPSQSCVEAHQIKEVATCKGAIVIHLSQLPSILAIASSLPTCAVIPIMISFDCEEELGTVGRYTTGSHPSVVLASALPLDVDPQATSIVYAPSPLSLCPCPIPRMARTSWAPCFMQCLTAQRHFLREFVGRTGAFSVLESTIGPLLEGISLQLQPVHPSKYVATITELRRILQTKSGSPQAGGAAQLLPLVVTLHILALAVDAMIEAGIDAAAVVFQQYHQHASNIRQVAASVVEAAAVSAVNGVKEHPKEMALSEHIARLLARQHAQLHIIVAFFGGAEYRIALTSMCKRMSSVFPGLAMSLWDSTRCVWELRSGDAASQAVFVLWPMLRLNPKGTMYDLSPLEAACTSLPFKKVSSPSDFGSVVVFVSIDEHDGVCAAAVESATAHVLSIYRDMGFDVLPLSMVSAGSAAAATPKVPLNGRGDDNGFDAQHCRFSQPSSSLCQGTAIVTSLVLQRQELQLLLEAAGIHLVERDALPFSPVDFILSRIDAVCILGKDALCRIPDEAHVNLLSRQFPRIWLLVECDALQQSDLQQIDQWSHCILAAVNFIHTFSNEHRAEWIVSIIQFVSQTQADIAFRGMSTLLCAPQYMLASFPGCTLIDGEAVPPRRSRLDALRWLVEAFTHGDVPSAGLNGLARNLFPSVSASPKTDGAEST